jgi:hypothetical protein
MKRALQGNASSEHAVEMGNRTQEIANFAWAVFEEL